MKRPLSPLPTLLLLTLGLGLGWWLRGAWAPPPEPVDEEAAHPPPQEATPRPSYSVEREEAQPQDGRPSAQAPTSTASPATASGTPAADPETRLRAQLEREAFGEAMGLYREAERREAGLAKRLRAVILDYLERYLDQGKDHALTALAEAFLSVHYDDIDVLLILARHQQASGYWTEAARTFQLVDAYSTAEPEERRQVRRAFGHFVEAADRQLAGQERGQTLIGFYQTLAQLDLARPADRVRLAELHLRHGDTDRARSLLTPLAEHPQLGARARSLLNDPAPARSSAPAAPPADRLSLTQVGSHYALPLTLDERSEVNLVIDTGASLTTLSQSAFERLRGQVRFTELGPQMFNTAGGSTRGMVYRVESVQLGRHRLEGAPVAVLDFDTPAGVDGLLGMNILSRFRFEVEQDEQRLKLQPR